MLHLFPSHIVFPEGFQYLPGFLSEAEEQALLSAIAGIGLHPFVFQGFEAKRKVASFGYDFHFDTRRLSKGQAIPAVFGPLIGKVADYLGIPAARWEELLITEYPPGSVINWHRDAPPFDVVAGISLQAAGTFRLRPYDKAKRHRKAVISFPVGRRSLYVMQGPARSEWEHSMTPAPDTRYSITLRTLREGSK